MKVQPHPQAGEREAYMDEFLLDSVDDKIDRIEHKTMKNSIPSHFLESDTSEHMCRMKLDEVIKQNEQLRVRLSEIEYENQLLAERNRQLEKDLKDFVSTLRSSHSRTPSFSKYRSTSEPEQQIHPRVRTADSSSSVRDQKNLRKMIASLQAENQLLTDMKEVCTKKLTELTWANRQLSEKVKDLQGRYVKEREDNIIKSQKLQEELLYNQQMEKNIEQLERMIRDSSEELNYLTYQSKRKQQEMNISHERFHREIDRMKQKVEKYKMKAHDYRAQRDELSVEIQKAKLELGSVTLRKYFPDDIDS